MVSFLELFGKITSFVVIIGSIFGSFVVYTYLLNIGQIGLFSEVISHPSSLLAITAVFSILILIIFLTFCSPKWSGDQLVEIGIVYAPAPTLTLTNKLKMLYHKIRYSDPFSGNSFIYFILWILCWVAFYFSNTNLLYVLLFYPAMECVAQCGIQYCKHKNIRWLNQIEYPYAPNRLNAIDFISIVLLNRFFTILFILFLMSIIAKWMPNEAQEWEIIIILIIAAILMGINIFLARINYKNKSLSRLSSTSGASANNTSQNNTLSFNVAHLLFIATCSIIFIISISLFIPNFSAKLLSPVGIIELPSDSHWYILHNTNQSNIDNKAEIQGFIESDRNKIKEKFCNYDEKKKVCDPSKIPFKNRNNVFFGYMAWNLGNIKVFCPEKTNFLTSDSEAKNKAETCLVLDTYVIQRIPTNYIGDLPQEPEPKLIDNTELKIMG